MTEEYDEEYVNALATELEELYRIAAEQGLTPAEYMKQEATKLMENKS